MNSIVSYLLTVACCQRFVASDYNDFYFVFHYVIDKGLKELVDIAVNKLF